MTDRIASAISFIPSEERETWLQIGMAIKHEMGDEGFTLWDQWSQTAPNYNAQAARSVWKSFKGSGVTVGTLVHTAKAYGWIDSEKPTKATQAQLEARRIQAAQRSTKEGIEREREQQAAAKKAAWVMHQTKPEQHAYLDSKGFKEAKGAVWWPSEDSNLLCIPMRIGGALVGLQVIDRNGAKRFLKGQVTSGAEYVIDNKGLDIWVEGYGTGLAVKACMASMMMRYRIHITFSAGNLKAMANIGFVIADNDKSKVGEKVAIATGLPYWMSDVEGEDFNDFYQRLGLFHASQALRKFLNNR